MHFKKSVLKNHLLYSIITLMAIAMLFPITAFAQAYVQTWDLVDSGKHLDYDGNSTYMSYINTGAATWNAYKSGVIRKDSAFVVEDGKQIKLSVIVRQLRRGGVKTMDNKQVNKAPQKSARLVLQAVTAIARSNANSLCRGLLYEPKVPTQLKK